MRAFILIIFVSMLSFSGNKHLDKKSDVYFINGILTAETYAGVTCNDQLEDNNLSATCDRDFLDDKLRDKNLMDEQHIDHDGVMLLYNFSRGKAADILESYYQLKESGQIDRALGFFAWLGEWAVGTVWDIGSCVGILPSEEEIKKWEKADVTKMLNQIKKESVQEDSNILVISHSQGNLFANRLYDEYFSTNPYEDYKYRFTNLQVATPADYVHAYNFGYVTNDEDIITWVPGALKANVQSCGIGHDFVRGYVNCDKTFNKMETIIRNFRKGKNGDGGDMPSGCTYNPNAKSFDVMLVLMSIFSLLYPLYHGAVWVRRRYG